MGRTRPGCPRSSPATPPAPARRAATPAERLLWRFLARGRTGARFSRQMPVEPYFADFLCREARLAIELDGFSHDTRADPDRRRDRRLAEQGYRTLRFTNVEVLGSPEGVVAAIRLAWPSGRERTRPTRRGTVCG